MVYVQLSCILHAALQIGSHVWILHLRVRGEEYHCGIFATCDLTCAFGGCVAVACSSPDFLSSSNEALACSPHLAKKLSPLSHVALQSCQDTLSKNKISGKTSLPTQVRKAWYHSTDLVAERKYEKFVATNTFVQEPTLERIQQQVQEPVAEPTEVPTGEYQLKYRLVQVPSKDYATEKSHRTRKRRRGLKGKSNDEKVPGFSDLSEYERLVRIFNALERFGCFKRKSGEQLKEVKRYKKSTEKFGSDVFMDFMFQEKHFDYNDVVKVRPSVKQVDFNRVRGYRSKFEHENITKESFMKIAFEEF